MKREVIGGCEDIIFKMRDCAKELIEEGDDQSLLALYWINKWIKGKPTSGDEAYFEKTGKHRQVPLYVYPANFAWAFNAYTELNRDGRAYYAINNIYKLVGGE